MFNLLNNTEINNLRHRGFILKKNILDQATLSKIKSIILLNANGKGNSETHYSSDLKSLLIKLLKFQIRKFRSSVFLLRLKDRLQLDFFASKIFEGKSKLEMIDGYFNKKTEQEILPWHSDQAYSGKLNITNFKNPNHFFYKFFFYLTPVESKDGCTSYIPESHKITYAVRSCIYNREIDYKPYWLLKDLVDLIKYKNNYKIILSKLANENILLSFLKIAEKCINDNDIDSFDFKANPGDVLIFNETGLHRGSKPSKQDRIVLRYLYSKKY